MSHSRDVSIFELSSLPFINIGRKIISFHPSPFDNMHVKFLIQSLNLYKYNQGNWYAYCGGGRGTIITDRSWISIEAEEDVAAGHITGKECLRKLDKNYEKGE